MKRPLCDGREVMAYCTNCSAVLGAGAKFCRSCGSPARSASEGPAEGPAETPDAGTGAARRPWPLKPDRLDKVVVLVVGAALVLAVVWELFQFFMGFLEGLLGA